LASLATAVADLILRTRGACQFDPEHLRQVSGEQRQRFGSAVRGFGPRDWAGPTRCPAWSAHAVLRHLCDLAAAGLHMGPGDSRLDFAGGFDPRTSPDQWMAASAGESPEATLDRYTATNAQLLALVSERLREGQVFDVQMPYGPMDWTVLMLHGFWDSWIHERDVLLARGDEHPTDADATAYAIGYGVFLSAAVASMFGDPVDEKLTLSGAGGGIIEVDSKDGVTLTLHRVTAAGPPAAEVADALAGRGRTAALVGDGPLGDVPAGSRTALLGMADFFRTPVAPLTRSGLVHHRSF
jgi:uncharacterized protein (TIGR03083 family)